MKKIAKQTWTISYFKKQIMGMNGFPSIWYRKPFHPLTKNCKNEKFSSLKQILTKWTGFTGFDTWTDICDDRTNAKQHERFPPLNNFRWWKRNFEDERIFEPWTFLLHERNSTILHERISPMNGFHFGTKIENCKKWMVFFFRNKNQHIWTDFTGVLVTWTDINDEKNC
jgi:hypothetical protein